MLNQVRLFSIVVGVSILLTGCKDLDLSDVTGFLNGNSSSSETTSSAQSIVSTEPDLSSSSISDTVTETSIRSDVSELYEKVKNFVEPKKKKEPSKKHSKKKKKKKVKSNKVKGKKAKSSKKKKIK